MRANLIGKLPLQRFLNKLEDKDEVTCGPEVENKELRSKRVIVFTQVTNHSPVFLTSFIECFQILDLDPNVLCPPESNGEIEEILLQLLCFVLALSIIAILSKLAYDYTVYRRRGQLPWLAMKLP